jgi:hypothetical protein
VRIQSATHAAASPSMEPIRGQLSVQIAQAGICSNFNKTPDEIGQND